MAGGILAGLLAHLGLEEASAACVKVGKKGCKGPQNKKCCQGAVCKGGSQSKTGKCGCKGSLKQCGGTCVNIQTSTQHCGGCDQPCGAGQTCQGGTCVGGGCTPDCTGGQTCQGGTCACPAETETSCNSFGQDCFCCPGGLFHCGGGVCHECCIGADCGGGGRYCDRNQGNTCRCPNQQEDCNGICKTCCTTEHCHVVGHDGYCRVAEPQICVCPNQADGWQGCPKADFSGYYCPDLKNDESNCGDCGRKCLGWNCIEGTCTRPD